MYKIPWYKKYLSVLVPVITDRLESDIHENLKIKYYQGQWQLESGDALYSDGHRYAPFKIAFNKLHKKGKLQQTRTFLLLGAGMGSALSRLHKVHKHFPQTTLVEYDAEIVHAGKQYLKYTNATNYNYQNIDAAEYIKNCTQKFDIIGIDLFEDLDNSPLISQYDFLNHVQRTLDDDATCIINTIFRDKKAKAKFEKQLQHFFAFEIEERKPNYIYILQHK